MSTRQTTSFDIPEQQFCGSTIPAQTLTIACGNDIHLGPFLDLEFENGDLISLCAKFGAHIGRLEEEGNPKGFTPNGAFKLELEQAASKMTCSGMFTYMKVLLKATEKSKEAAPSNNSKPAPKHPVQFKDWTCQLVLGQYGNGRVALSLVQVEPIATATVNLPNEDLPEGHVFIKDYNENEGMVNALVAAGIVKDTGKTVRSGFVEISICRLLVDPT